jgi:hypothetical protein
MAKFGDEGNLHQQGCNLKMKALNVPENVVEN